MGKIRVEELAAQMGIGSKEVLFLLQSIGVDVKSPQAALDESTVLAILQGKTHAPKQLIVRDAETRAARPQKSALNRIKIVDKPPARETGPSRDRDRDARAGGAGRNDRPRGSAASAAARRAKAAAEAKAAAKAAEPARTAVVTAEPEPSRPKPAPPPCPARSFCLRARARRARASLRRGRPTARVRRAGELDPWAPPAA